MDTSPTKDKLIAWLEKRIAKTKNELESSIGLTQKVSKGAKLRGYRDCLEYIRKNSL
jgi:hypothetical protein